MATRNAHHKKNLDLKYVLRNALKSIRITRITESSGDIRSA